MVAGAVAGKILNIVINMVTVALCIKQTFMDSANNEHGELVFDNFSFIVKSTNCFKLFITAYHGVSTKGSEMFGFVCLLGFFLLSYVIATHLSMNHKAWARTRIVAMSALMAVGVSLLCRGMVIPNDHVWHTTAVPTIIIFIVLFEAALLVRIQIKENGDDQHLLRDFLMKSAETPISIYRWVDLMQQTQNPWDTEKILHLVGSGLPVLIGGCQIGWIVYKAGIIHQVIEWLRNLPRSFTREEEQIPRAATIKEDHGDGDTTEKVATKEDVEIVVVAVPA